MNKIEKKQTVAKIFAAVPTKEIAAKTGLKFATIRTIASRNKLKKNYRIWTAKQIIYLIDKYNAVPVQQIADKLNRTKWGVINKYREIMSLR